jgi:hypothetical protein
MSKSNPTLFNVPYYYGTCKLFLKVFSGGAARARRKPVPRKTEDVEREEVLTGLRR